MPRLKTAQRRIIETKGHTLVVLLLLFPVVNLLLTVSYFCQMI